MKEFELKYGCNPNQKPSRIYMEDELVELVGVCDINEERAIAASKKFGVPYYLDAQTMLDELKPDLVSVCTGGYEYCSDKNCRPCFGRRNQSPGSYRCTEQRYCKER